MRILSMSGGKTTPIEALLTSLGTKMKEVGPQRAGQGLVMAIESIDAETSRTFESSYQSVSKMVIESLQSLEGEHSLNFGYSAYNTNAKKDNADAQGNAIPAGLTPEALQAATMVAMAANNLTDYANAATDTAIVPSGYKQIGVATEGLGGKLNHSDLKMIQESFGEQQLRASLQWSIVFNAAAAQQDPFGSVFYRPVILSPNEGGLAVTVARSVIVGRNLRPNDSKPNDLNRRNLIDASRYPSILEDESTRIYPVVEEDGSNAAIFVDPNLLAPKVVSVEDFEFRTSALRPGRIGLIEASTPEILRDRGVMDTTDEISNGVRLETVYLRIGDDVVKYGTRYLPYSGFVKTPEGDERLIGVNFTTKEFVLDKNSKNVAGAPVALAQVLAANNLTARIGVSVSGTLNVHTSELSVNGSAYGLESLIDEDGTEVGRTSGPGKEVADALAAVSFLGYELFAVRTGENRRQIGLLLERLEERFVYNVPLSAPISVLAPAGTNKAGTHLEALIDAQRQRCSNDAVTSLFNHAGMLSEYVTAVRKKAAIPRIGAAGHVVVKAFYEKIRIDAKEVVMSVKDHEKAVDIASLLTNTIKDVGVRMLIASNYPAALAASLTGSKEAKLLVGTDNYIAQHLMTQGDLRTFGAVFKEAIVVPTLNEKMDGKIFVTLTRENASNVPDILEYGWLAYIPELISVMPVSRNGNTRDEAMVQARYLHINNLPILAEIDVVNLSEALVQKLAVKVETMPGQEVPGDEEDKSPEPGVGDNGTGAQPGQGTGQGTQP